MLYEGTPHGNAKLAYSEIILILNPISPLHERILFTLSQARLIREKKGRPHRGSNTGQHDLQSYALTTELWSLANSVSRDI